MHRTGSTSTAAARLRAAATRLVGRVEHWTQPRWAMPAGDGGTMTRADAMHALVQRLADLVASVEGREPLPVPRLPNDLALPDQLRVMVADLGLAGAPDAVLRAAVDEIDAAAPQF